MSPVERHPETGQIIPVGGLSAPATRAEFWGDDAPPAEPPAVEHVASVAADGGMLHVVRRADAVAIADGLSRREFGATLEVDPSALGGLLVDAAGRETDYAAGCQLVGEIDRVRVMRWGHSVQVDDTRTSKGALMLNLDQARQLAEALLAAAGDERGAGGRV